jgi:HlyD family secretion protein
MKHGSRASIAGLALALAGCGGDRGDALLGTLERDRIELIAEAQETIVEVAVREGASVKAGDLVRGSIRHIQTRVAEARAKTSGPTVATRSMSPARVEDVNEARARVAALAARSKTESPSSIASRGRHPGPHARSALDRQRAPGIAIADERAAARSSRSSCTARACRSRRAGRGARRRACAGCGARTLTLTATPCKAPRAGIVEDALPYKLGERPPKGAPVVACCWRGAVAARVLQPGAAAHGGARGHDGDRAHRRHGSAWKAEIRYVSSEAAFTPYYALNARDRAASPTSPRSCSPSPTRRLPTGMPVEVTLAEAGRGREHCDHARDLARRFERPGPLRDRPRCSARADLRFLGPNGSGSPPRSAAAGCLPTRGTVTVLGSSGAARTPRSCGASWDT